MADAHSFTFHGTGQSLLEAKLLSIDVARSSVCMETFTFRDSDVGLRFRSALAAAARRGVRVRLIVDAVGSFGLRRDYFEELVAAGGAMRWFNELRLASFSFRDHRKLLVVDDTQALVGGGNIAPEYEGDGITMGWRDGGVSVRGPVVAVLGAEFDRQWERASGRHWTFPHGGMRQRAPAGGGREVGALFIKPGFGRNPLRDALWQDLATAKDVAITAAYFSELTEAYAKLIPSKDSPVVVSCRTGHQASQTYFVLRHLLGYRRVSWYDGGWAEWASRPELPIETGGG